MRYAVDPDRMFRLGFVGKPFAEEQNVGGNRCVGVFLEGVVGQTNCRYEICPGGHRAAGAHVERIERVMRVMQTAIPPGLRAKSIRFASWSTP